MTQLSTFPYQPRERVLRFGDLTIRAITPATPELFAANEKLRREILDGIAARLGVPASIISGEPRAGFNRGSSPGNPPAAT